MVSRWKEVKVKDVAQLIGGYAFKSKDFSKDGEIPVVKIKSLKDRNIVIEDGDFVSKSFIELNKKYHIQFNDILIALTGSHITLPSSAVGRVVKSRHERILLLNQRVGKLMADPKVCDHDFLYYSLITDYFFHSVGLRAKGAANQANISGGDVGEIRIALPPLPTQRKIASILLAYDDLIENNLKRIKLLEELAQIAYEEWFVRFRINKEQLTIDEETGLPVGWRKVKLTDVCTLTMGQSPKSEFYNDTGEGLPFHQGVRKYGFRFPENDTWSTAGYRIAEKGDVLFSVRAPVGRLNIAIEKIIIGRGLAGIRHKRGWNSFLFYQLQNIFFEEDMMGGGAIFNSVTKADMERIDLIEADEKIMDSINSRLDPINELIDNLTIQNQLIKEARDILLPRLMTGVIDVEKMSTSGFAGLEDEKDLILESSRTTINQEN